MAPKCSKNQISVVRMRNIFALLLVGVAAVLASPLPHDSDNWVLIPDANYNMHLVEVSEAQFRKQLGARNGDFPVNFYLYTKKNPRIAEVIATGDDSFLKKSNFNPNNPTRFVIHGWLQDQNSDMNGQIRDQYLSRGDFNVIIVGWGVGAGSADYMKSAANTLLAGQKVGAFIDFLIAKGKLDPNNTYIAGHSLGSHVAGVAGKSVTLGKINTIFGLDPALPLFFLNEPSKRLDKGDALYVETIHTDSGILGFLDPIGDSSFYVNWGKDQPGCSHGLNLDLTTLCSHQRSCEYFAESIGETNRFVAVECSSFSEIQGKTCNLKGATTVRMGGEPSNYERELLGLYYLPINSKSPYATGKIE